MIDFPDYYPASPTNVPEDLTAPSASYRRHVNLVTVSLLLFFALYFGIILMLLLWMVASVALFGICGGIWAAVLLVPLAILVKNLFHWQKTSTSHAVEIDLQDHPRLQRFLECVCEETGAPMPHRVYLNYQVNAAAGTDVSVFSLVLGPSRTLLLGLGLVNFLNLTEFKALLAHEFGHFSQFKSGSSPFVRLAMRVMFNILHGTRSIGLDKVMEWLFIFVVKLNQALAREMEFHADLVAVSVAGSDAVPNLLYKCLWAEMCLARTLRYLEAARDHDLYSRDIFLHQRRTAHFLRRHSKNQQLGEPPELPEDEPDFTCQLFARARDRDRIAEMWADHPSNYDREINAKAYYIRNAIDTTPAWTLFDQADEISRLVSVECYQEVFRIRKGAVKWSSGARVQKFLDEEQAETNFDAARYGVLYNQRCLESMSLRGLRDRAEAGPLPVEALLASHRSLYTAAVKDFAVTFQRHIEEFRMLLAVAKGWYEPDDGRVRMRGKTFALKKAAGLLTDLDKEIAEDVAWLLRFDAKVFVTYFTLARHLDEGLAEELYQRYRFHYVMQGMWKILQPHKSPMGYMFEFLSSRKNGTLDEYGYHLLIEVFRQAYDAVRVVLNEAEHVKFPELSNMPAGEPIRPFLLKGALQRKPSHFDTRIKVAWLAKFANQFQDVEKRLDRLHYKGLGAILALQENIGAQAEKRWRK